MYKIFQNKNIIITGHTGFKGSWLSLWLTQLGAKVTGISNGIPTKPSNFNALNLCKEINDLRCDIKDLKKLKIIFNNVKPDFVFPTSLYAEVIFVF